MPCAAFIWNVENVCDAERKVSITFTFKNGTGTKKQDAEGMCCANARRCRNSFLFNFSCGHDLHAGNATTETFTDDDVAGVQIKQTIAGLECTYTVASKSADDVNEVSCCAKFDPAASGEKLWDDLKENGKLTDKCIDENFKSEFGLVGW